MCTLRVAKETHDDRTREKAASLAVLVVDIKFLHGKILVLNMFKI